MLTYNNTPEFFDWANQFPDARVSYNEVDYPSFLNFRHVPLEARTEFYSKMAKIEFKNVNNNWRQFQTTTMYEYIDISDDDRKKLAHYSQDIWDYRCNVEFLDLYPWAERLI